MAVLLAFDVIMIGVEGWVQAAAAQGNPGLHGPFGREIFQCFDQ